MTKEEALQSLEILKTGYIAVLNDLDVMKNWGKTQLEALYQTKIGIFEIEILELQIALKAAKKKIQLCHQNINHDQTPDFTAIEATVAEMTKKAYTEVNEGKKKVVWGKAVLSNLHSSEFSMELRKIYRTIAKALHPDINPEMTELQQEMWQQFRFAYDNGDLDRMKALQIVYSEQLAAKNTNADEQSVENIQLQISALKQGILELEEQKKALEAEFPFKIADLIRDDEWVAEQQDRLAKEIEEYKKALAEQNQIYQLIKETYE